MRRRRDPDTGWLVTPLGRLLVVAMVACLVAGSIASAKWVFIVGVLLLAFLAIGVLGGLGRRRTDNPHRKNIGPLGDVSDPPDDD
jgi:hypothetical protein